jgi:hypothetical protein
MLKSLTLFSLFFFSHTLSSQYLTFTENKKWGIKDSAKVVIAPVFDTIFNFDKNARVCLACFKSKNTNTNQYIKVTNTVYSCNYLNTESKRLIIKTSSKDTCSVFQLTKSSVKHYNENDTLFKVKVKKHMYLISKSFKQLSFKPYYDIELCDDPGFYVAQGLNEVDVPMYGLITNKEETIISFEYSGIKLNPIDSLVMVCGTGYGAGTEDYVFDYKGKKLRSFRHHIDLATKEYIVFKAFEPKEHFFSYCIATKEEKELIADEIKFYNRSSILLRLKTTWWVYNLKTQEKTELKN